MHISKHSPSHHFETLSRSRSVVDCAHIQAFTLLSTNTLSSSRSVVDCAHIRAFTFRLKITVGCLTSTYPSIRNKNLHTCWTPWSKRETCGLWARPPVLTPVPVQAFHSRACLNLHHSDIQGTAQKSSCVNTFLRPSSRKKQKPSCYCLVAWAGHTEQRQRTRETPHTGQRRRETTESTM